MVKKSVSRSRKRDLEEPDKIIVFLNRIVRFITNHKKKVITAAVTIFFLVIVIGGIKYFSIKAERKAFAMLEQSYVKYESAAGKIGPEKAYEMIAGDFQEIIDKYSLNKGGKFARMVYADICFNGGDYEKAIAFYKTSLNDFEKEPFIRHLILNSLGYCYTEKKEYKTASEYFKTLVASSDYGMKDEALFNLSQIYSLLGRKNESIKRLKELISGYPDSVYISIAKEKVARYQPVS